MTSIPPFTSHDYYPTPFSVPEWTSAMQSINGTGNLAQIKQKLSTIEEQFKLSLENQQNSLNTKKNLGEIYRIQSYLEEGYNKYKLLIKAKIIFKEVIAQENKDGYIFYGLGDVLSQIADFYHDQQLVETLESAELYLKKSEQIVGENPVLIKTLANVLKQQLEYIDETSLASKIQEAKKYIKKSLLLNQDSDFISYHFGDILKLEVQITLPKEQQYACKRIIDELDNTLKECPNMIELKPVLADFLILYSNYCSLDKKIELLNQSYHLLFSSFGHYPDDVLIESVLAKNLYYQGCLYEYPKNIDLFNRSLSLFFKIGEHIQHDPDELSMISYALYTFGQYSQNIENKINYLIKAEDYVKKCLKSDPKNSLSSFIKQKIDRDFNVFILSYLR